MIDSIWTHEPDLPTVFRHFWQVNRHFYHAILRLQVISIDLFRSSFDCLLMALNFEWSKCSNWIRFYGFWILTGSKLLNMYCYFIRRRSKVSYIVALSFVSILLPPSGRLIIPSFTCITIQPSATISLYPRCSVPHLPLWDWLCLRKKVSLVTRGHHNSSFFSFQNLSNSSLDDFLSVILL